MVWADVFAVNRRAVMTSAFLVVHGRLQSVSGVIHVVAERFTDLTDRLAELKADGDAPPPASANPQLVRSRDFH